MSETTVDTSGIQRTPEGTLVDQKTAPSATTTAEPTKPETKPATETAEAKPADAKDSKPSLLNEKDKVEAGAPEKYADFTAPEGFELDKATVDKFLPIAKELGLSQAGAQKLVDFQSELSKQASEAGVQLWMDTQKQWVDEIKADKDIGHKLPEVKTTISKAIDSVLGPELAPAFREAMDFTGAGNNPAFIKGFFKFAQRFTEGTHVPAGGPSKFGQVRPGSAPTTGAAAIYPHLPSANRG